MSAPQADLLVVAEQRRLMGTQISVHVAAPAAPPAQAATARMAIGACLDWMAEVEACLTRFSPDSELRCLNDHAGEWHDVSAMLFTVTQLAVQAATASDGLFDPTLLPLLAALGYDRDFDEIAQREVHPALPNTSGTSVAGQWRAIALDEQRRRIKLPPGAQLDVGGIAKGWAADCALDRFFTDFAHVLIDVGGDMRVRGGPLPGNRWSIGVQDPRTIGAPGPTQHRAVLTLGSGGIATSGAGERWWYRGGARQHHIVDPRTGHPARVWIDAQDDADAASSDLIAAATALAPTAAQAEVAAKAALLLGYPQALAHAEQTWRAEAASGASDSISDPTALLLVLGNGAVVTSSHLRAYMERYAGGGDIWILE